MEAPDLHNFGQAVQKLGRGSENIFQKPRPIYWEWLFFGRSSPLSTFFDGKSRLPGISPRQIIFNLVTEMRADYCGESAEIIGKPNADLIPSHTYGLGVLLAYCYIFGIRDLHKHNLIMTDTHLQVVDAEVVLSKLILPHETLLLPFKEVGVDLCGASSVLSLRGGVSPDTICTILDGYFDVFENVLGQLDRIRSVFEMRPEIALIPVRHILRDTFHYRAWKEREPAIPFFESEVSQLRRGDVPYYFKFLGRPEVFEYTDRSGAFATVILPDAFQKGAAREAQNPSSLLDERRLREHLLGPGLLYLAKTLLPLAGASVIAGEGYQLSVLEREIRASTLFGDFATSKP